MSAREPRRLDVGVRKDKRDGTVSVIATTDDGRRVELDMTWRGALRTAAALVRSAAAASELAGIDEEVYVAMIAAALDEAGRS